LEIRVEILLKLEKLRGGFDGEEVRLLEKGMILEDVMWENFWWAVRMGEILKCFES
jgi:hypothetical protein